MQCNSIGQIRVTSEGFFLELDGPYRQGLQGLEGFSHLCLLWWCHLTDSEDAREILEVPAPYQGSPEIMGIFATRSPVRPNPIAVTMVQVLGIDLDQGQVQIAYIDAEDGTPLLDIKPYTPSLDRVAHPLVPTWCAHWPKSLEDSEEFDWSSVFTF